MGRLFLALWLALFAVQTCDVIAAIAPDGCVEESGAPDDRCPESCARCVCCARVAAFLPPGPATSPVAGLVRATVAPPLDPSTTPSPRAVFHVPKPIPT
jgi:hypothetical protein